MNKENQLSLIEKFFSSNEETIIINQVNDEIGNFYLSVIKHYADKQSVKIDINDGNKTMASESDLFGLKKIEIFNISNTKKMAEVLNTQNKKIIFTDYKNFKKLNSKYNCINGYKYELDITFFIKAELKIDNDELLYFCKNNPVLLMSETSKYLINNNLYTSDQNFVEEKKHILNIRKAILEIKKRNLDIKGLYLNIKKEVVYKKLNFLIY